VHLAIIVLHNPDECLYPQSHLDRIFKIAETSRLLNMFNVLYTVHLQQQIVGGVIMSLNHQRSRYSLSFIHTRHPVSRLLPEAYTTNKNTF
jgi:hypothetical protein